MAPRIPRKTTVQARIRPDARKELERQAAKAGLRFCTYLAQQLEAIAMKGKPLADHSPTKTESSGKLRETELVVSIDE